MGKSYFTIEINGKAFYDEANFINGASQLAQQHGVPISAISHGKSLSALHISKANQESGIKDFDISNRRNKSKSHKSENEKYFKKLKFVFSLLFLIIFIIFISGFLV